MPCNANGHPPDCNCGWGGVFHQASTSLGYGPGYWSQPNSHTIPNANCPICGKSVFFYRSPDSGRVFFDSLGPPWPKHPCTDTSTSQRSGQSFTGYDTREGWWPFLCSAIAEGKDGQGCVLYNTEDRGLYVNTQPNRFSLDTPIWIRRRDENRAPYQVSTLRTIDGKTTEVRFEAFKNFAALRDERLRSGAKVNVSGFATTLPAIAVVAMPILSVQAERQPAQHKPILHLKKSTKAVSLQKSKTDLSVAPGNGKKVRRTFLEKTVPKSPLESVNSVSTQKGLSAMEIAFGRLASTAEGSQLLSALLQKK